MSVSMSCEFRPIPPESGYIRRFDNGEHISDVRVQVEDLPQGSNVAPFYPTRAPGGRMSMEINPEISVQPYKLNFYIVGTLPTYSPEPEPEPEPIYSVRHAQMQGGLPVEFVEFDNTRRKGILYPLEGSDYPSLDDSPF